MGGRRTKLNKDASAGSGWKRVANDIQLVDAETGGPANWNPDIGISRKAREARGKVSLKDGEELDLSAAQDPVFDQVEETQYSVSTQKSPVGRGKAPQLMALNSLNSIIGIPKYATKKVHLPEQIPPEDDADLENELSDGKSSDGGEVTDGDEFDFTQSPQSLKDENGTDDVKSYDEGEVDYATSDDEKSEQMEKEYKFGGDEDFEEDGMVVTSARNNMDDTDTANTAEIRPSTSNRVLLTEDVDAVSEESGDESFKSANDGPPLKSPSLSPNKPASERNYEITPDVFDSKHRDGASATPSPTSDLYASVRDNHGDNDDEGYESFIDYSDSAEDSSDGEWNPESDVDNSASESDSTPNSSAASSRHSSPTSDLRLEAEELRRATHELTHDPEPATPPTSFLDKMLDIISDDDETPVKCNRSVNRKQDGKSTIQDIMDVAGIDESPDMMKSSRLSNRKRFTRSPASDVLEVRGIDEPSESPDVTKKDDIGVKMEENVVIAVDDILRHSLSDLELAPQNNNEESINSKVLQDLGNEMDTMSRWNRAIRRMKDEQVLMRDSDSSKKVDVQLEDVPKKNSTVKRTRKSGKQSASAASSSGWQRVPNDIQIVDADTGNEVDWAAKTGLGDRRKKDGASSSSKSGWKDIIDVDAVTDGVANVKLDGEDEGEDCEEISDAEEDVGRMPDWLRVLEGKALSRKGVAARLLRELDEEVLGSALSGVVNVRWNKRLLTTAGQCEMRRVTDDGSREARIELSSKVLDEPSRLYNTMAHEMCHAAAWVIDGVYKPPHGKVFKKWAKRFMRWDGSLNISTCHQYEVRTRYKYECSVCDGEWNRHSKSIDTDKMRCDCGGRITLTKS